MTTNSSHVWRITLVGAADGIEAETPIFMNDDGSINREKTLALPCYWNFKL